MVEPAQEHTFRQDSEGAHHNGSHQKGQPVVHPGVGHADPGHVGPQHVLGAVGEIDDVQQAENQGQPQTQYGVERTVDQTQQKLAEKRLGGDADQFKHLEFPLAHGIPGRTPARAPAPACSLSSYFFR